MKPEYKSTYYRVEISKEGTESKVSVTVDTTPSVTTTIEEIPKPKTSRKKRRKKQIVEK